VTFGFFFLPLLEIKPNRLASGIPVNLFELQGDLRYLALFILALAPLFVAFQSQRGRRGWTLVLIGNLLIFLTLLLPAGAAVGLLESAETVFEEGTRISNPRIFTSSAIAVGLLGGYIILFGGLRDLAEEKVTTWLRVMASATGAFFIIIVLVNGNLDIYSILVEFSQRGATLGQRFIEHFVFVLVSLAAGLVIGIALGLWAARDEHMENIILYIVGIIQTIPSLALFGVLLVPLARLGNQRLVDVALFFIISLVAAGVIVAVVVRAQANLPGHLRPWAIILAFVALSIPVSLFAVVVITFGFKSVLNVFVNTALSQLLLLVIAGFLLSAVLLWLNRNSERLDSIRWLRLARYGLFALSGVGLLLLIVSGAGQVIAARSLETLTIRDLGVSGIGTAPAIIALTLYSLLPLVRNTYAGLRNVDPAVIDSGRGMGMTPSQIFFQIELPLALPVIMAGVRNAGISLVGIAAVASIIGAGALGDFILLGVNTTSVDLILLGAIPAIILAVMLDALMQILEGLFTSPGIRRQQQ
jgi:osmoprotectant transport system permease protein